MHVKRKRLSNHNRAPIDPVMWAILSDTPLPAGANPFTLIMGGRDATMRPLWGQYRASILAQWIESKPGTRPALWWKYDSPRASTARAGRFAGTKTGERMPEPRQLLSGSGVPLHEATAYAPAYRYGIPNWCGDPDAPPVFESQHAYLKRHGLLEPGERKPRTEPHPHSQRLESTTSRQARTALDRP